MYVGQVIPSGSPVQLSLIAALSFERRNKFSLSAHRLETRKNNRGTFDRKVDMKTWRNNALSHNFSKVGFFKYILASKATS